jgi:HlyD family secretion protein
MVENIERIATGLKLDAAQQAAFDAAIARMRERAGQMRQRMQQSAGAGQSSGGGIGGFGGGRGFGGGQGGGGQRSGQGGGQGGRMAERMKQSFAPFRATLDAAQQARWDAELAALSSGKRAPVYKLVDGKPEQVVVRVGASDGTRTEVLGGDLKRGDLVMVGSARPDAAK